ncbi:MAG: GNAT family N-acetyltransferase [Tannerella sp.]|jgi:ribosomal protein S18 acetylase RimI-like enzyme|nr:GNAT family N-acetyltransferase [Tannerella sp.]
MNLSNRKADTNDCSLIRDLASRIWEPTYGSILSKEQLVYMFEMMYSTENIYRQMTELQHQYFITFADEKPAGYLSFEKKSADTFIFQKIYALPEFHGKGVGRYMVEQGISHIRTIHPHPFTVELYVNRENPAVGFYEHTGFKKSGTRDHDIGNGYYMNDYIMSIKID